MRYGDNSYSLQQWNVSRSNDLNSWTVKEDNKDSTTLISDTTPVNSENYPESIIRPEPRFDYDACLKSDDNLNNLTPQNETPIVQVASPVVNIPSNVELTPNVLPKLEIGADYNGLVSTPVSNNQNFVSNSNNILNKAQTVSVKNKSKPLSKDINGGR